MADDDDHDGNKPKRVADDVRTALVHVPMPPSVDLRECSPGTVIEVVTASGHRYAFTFKDPTTLSADGNGGVLGFAVIDVVIEGSCISPSGAMLRSGHLTEGWHLSLRVQKKGAGAILTSPIMAVHVSGFQVIPALHGVN